MSDLHKSVDNAKQDIFAILAECMVQTTKSLEKLKEPYSSELVELIDKLQIIQSDLNFIYDEGRAFGKYLKSRGCTEKDIQQFWDGLCCVFN